MKKIPTVFVRDEATNRKYVKDERHPDCGWVFAGEGIPTRKYDGTCVMWDGSDWYFRREVKPGKDAPVGWVEIDRDDVTGKRVGWEPARPASGFIGPLREAIEGSFVFGQEIPTGTYELCGPKINGNPEGFAAHRVVAHDDAEVFLDVPMAFDRIGLWLHAHTFEGVVWHHSDGRMAKLKRKDFPAPVVPYTEGDEGR